MDRSRLAEPATAITLFADDTLRAAADRVAEHELDAATVVLRGDHDTPVGVITTRHLLAGRLQDLLEDRDRERVLAPRPLKWRFRRDRSWPRT